MEKGDNVTKTFKGDAHVSAKNKNLKSAPNYFWKNTEDFATELGKSIDNSILNDNTSSSESLGSGQYVVRETLGDSFAWKSLIPMHTPVRNFEPIKEDVINHPKHYNTEVFEQVIHMMVKLFTIDDVLAFCKLNSFKYRMRAGVKDATKIEEDINKAIWYENKFIILSQSDKQILKG